MASVSPAFRPGAHLPVPQADTRLDPAPHPHPRAGRPLELAHHHRPHPTPPRPRPHLRSPPTMGETRHRAAPNDPGPRSPRVSEPPREHRSTGQCTETLTTRPRTPTRFPQPASRHPPRRRQKDHDDRDNQHEQGSCRLNDKLRPGLPPRCIQAARALLSREARQEMACRTRRAQLGVVTRTRGPADRGRLPGG